MLELDEVTSRVERIELLADTRQRHLAHLHTLQAGRTQNRPNGPTEVIAGGLVRPRRSRAAWSGGLAAAAVAAVAGTSALLAPAHHAPAIPITPGAGSNTAMARTSSATDRLTAPVTVTSTGSDAPGLTDAEFSKQLAGILGLTAEQASAATAQLNKLGRHGATDPTSSQFTQIAAGAGVTPARLAAAIDQIKKGQLAITASTGPGQPKDGDIKSGPPTTTTSPSGVMAKSTAQSPGQNMLTTNRSIELLASTLGLSRQKAADLAGKLAVLEHGAGLDPGSSGFQTIAHDFGLTPDQLARAIDQIKKAGN